jgi:hypothetical protein
MLYQIGNEKRWRSTEDPAVVAELQRILALERARLATCDASTAVVVAKACEGFRRRQDDSRRQRRLPAKLGELALASQNLD